MTIPEAGGPQMGEIELLHRIHEMTIRHSVQLEQIQRAQSENVTRSEFEPVKRVVYGAVGLALLSLFGALIALVVG